MVTVSYLGSSVSHKRDDLVKYDCSAIDVARCLYSPCSADNLIFVYRMDKENDDVV